MGWLPSIFGGEKSSDPRAGLDPKLREFLDKEAPAKYSPEPAPTTTTTTAQEVEKPRPIVPRESLYQDGRYAHIWKDYQSFSQQEEATATEHDKLKNVLEGVKEQRNAVATAAMENCAAQQEEWINCMKTGRLSDQLQMCRHQVRRFERCYTMQSRFLRALGYGSVFNRSQQVDEDIQMHADSLFNRMLQHEAAIAEAKAAGRPVPVFESVVPVPRPAAAAAAAVQPTDEIKKAWRETLDKLPETEREFEAAALRGDFESHQDVVRQIKHVVTSKEQDREARQAAGQGTFTDMIWAMWNSGGKGSQG